MGWPRVRRAGRPLWLRASLRPCSQQPCSISSYFAPLRGSRSAAPFPGRGRPARPPCCRGSRPRGECRKRAVPVTFCSGRSWKGLGAFLLPVKRDRQVLRGQRNRYGPGGAHGRSPVAAWKSPSFPGLRTGGGRPLALFVAGRNGSVRAPPRGGSPRPPPLPCRGGRGAGPGPAAGQAALPRGARCGAEWPSPLPAPGQDGGGACALVTCRGAGRPSLRNGRGRGRLCPPSSPVTRLRLLSSPLLASPGAALVPLRPSGPGSQLCPALERWGSRSASPEGGAGKKRRAREEPEVFAGRPCRKRSLSREGLCCAVTGLPSREPVREGRAGRLLAQLRSSLPSHSGAFSARLLNALEVVGGLLFS